MENSPALLTDRLELRRWREADSVAAHMLLSDPVVNRFLPWWPTKSEAEALTFLRERYLNTYDDHIGYRYAVCPRGTDTPIGYVNVDRGSAHDLGYGIDRTHQNQGLITEAAQAVIARVREDGAIPFLTATHDRENPRAARSCASWAWSTGTATKNSCSPNRNWWSSASTR